MKFNKLPLRAFNVLFHTHTVSGIVISFALFVIFFAGAFSLFRNELSTWENQKIRGIEETDVRFSEVVQAVEKNYPNFDRKSLFTVVMPGEGNPLVRFFGAEKPADSLSRPKRIRALLDPVSLEVIPNEHPRKTVSETLYRLHYFSQIPFIGLWISGFVALFFLFAIITGVLIHWQDIVKRFYAFSIKTTAKRIWTFGHTTLGMIGLPFQVMYAITGALFGLLTLLLAPSAFVLFDGDTDKVLGAVAPERVAVVDSSQMHLPLVDLNQIQDQAQAVFPDYHLLTMRVRNYGEADGIATVYIDDKETVSGNGSIVYGLAGGKEILRVDPRTKTYTNTVYNFLLRLHFASYGSMLTKVIYFILALMTCFMLISGIMLWQKARDNARYTDKQRRFHYRVTKWFLSICMSLFPAVTILFLANKLVPIETPGHTPLVNAIFFLSWLGLTIGGLFIKNYRSIFRFFFAAGGIMALLIPIANGIVTGDWIWVSLQNGYDWVAVVDIFWLVIGLAITAILFTKVDRWSNSRKVLDRKLIKKKTESAEKPAVRKRVKPKVGSPVN